MMLRKRRRDLRHKLRREGSAFEGYNIEWVGLIIIKSHQRKTAVFPRRINSEDQHGSVVGLDQFKQNAASARGVDEDIAMPAGPDLDFLRDQPHAILFELADSRFQVGNAERNVMQSLAAFGDELGND